ncbi:peptide transporter family 1 isoform X2 [Onthophagus taurus]|uniref:peptide transporter family 1 isoform X2 n=1 Tax=Onthophagus taurus TaxID=166361 RepID=UPI0039BE4BB1
MGKKDDESHRNGDALTDSEDQLEKLPYPKSVFFIVSNEFCERFSYYGMRTILTLYLVDILLFSKPDAKIIYHTFTMFVYFFPIFGAMLADSLLGKFYTIFYVSIIYAIGNIVLAMSAAPPLNFPMVAFSMVGLLLIAIGTGGIKPCVSAFGGDQFKLPQQELQLAKFFSMFYFSINAGSLISTTVTPLLREDVHCFEDDSCYSLAFGVPGVLMIVSIVIFVLGKPLYTIRKPEGNMVIRVSKCISTAIKKKWKSKEKAEHWLDHAKEEHGDKLVSDVKALLKVLLLYIPLPVFWALFDQQGTGWTFQARIMNGDVGFYTILPDQMQVVNPLLILLFIPIFQYGVYPLMDKLHILQTPLKRLVTGGLLAALAFIISACISLALEASMPRQPSPTEAHVRIYNNMDCPIKIIHDNTESIIEKNLFYENIDINSNEWTATVDFTCANLKCDGCVATAELNKAFGYYFINSDNIVTMEQFLDSSEKDDNNGYPKVRSLISGSNLGVINVTYLNSKGNIMAATNASDPNFFELKPDDYQIEIGDTKIDITLKLGGVYAVLVRENTNGIFEAAEVTVTDPNSIHMLLLIPQYVIITMGEIMFSITGLEFSYSQAPTSMKSVLQACWLLTTAVGNLIVIIIESVHPFDEESLNFFLYAGLMIVDMFIFALMAMRYKYVVKEESDSEVSSADQLPDKSGIENKGFLKEKDDA